MRPGGRLHVFLETWYPRRVREEARGALPRAGVSCALTTGLREDLVATPEHGTELRVFLVGACRSSAGDRVGERFNEMARGGGIDRARGGDDVKVRAARSTTLCFTQPSSGAR